MIRPASPSDASAVAEIYNHYIATSHSTFEIEAIDASEMLRRMNDGRPARYPFLIAEDDGEIIGYAYGGQFRPRPAYKHSIEVSVYVRPGNERRGVGTQLYTRLLWEISERDFHVVIAGISLPNNASIKLHERFGFKQVAHLTEVGRKFGRWIDVGYWEMIISK